MSLVAIIKHQCQIKKRKWKWESSSFNIFLPLRQHLNKDQGWSPFECGCGGGLWRRTRRRERKTREGSPTLSDGIPGGCQGGLIIIITLVIIVINMMVWWLTCKCLYHGDHDDHDQNDGHSHADCSYDLKKEAERNIRLGCICCHCVPIVDNWDRLHKDCAEKIEMRQNILLVEN